MASVLAWISLNVFTLMVGAFKARQQKQDWDVASDRMNRLTSHAANNHIMKNTNPHHFSNEQLFCPWVYNSIVFQQADFTSFSPSGPGRKFAINCIKCNTMCLKYEVLLPAQCSKKDVFKLFENLRIIYYRITKITFLEFV